ncbi:hypothetical protein Acsp03_47530 [Actinomadura sp. NBRC 104412]|uniref:hypothetical protein n=1 Tax=Actinomadura sp. NBRC 104412 TaxID=3032203 RepID=UPI0024A17024|nr:hypothetical protein [Actinomadura sp. NBRC 104412]GLZ07287.1 hypothetical protein Acsp03_47530 [Actinomadura sp. NBRC 104412]
MDTQTSSEDRDLAQLRRDFTGHRIWRAMRWDGQLGDWVASLHDSSAGIDPTVICSTPEDLRAALRSEAERAAARRRLW